MNRRRLSQSTGRNRQPRRIVAALGASLAVAAFSGLPVAHAADMFANRELLSGAAISFSSDSTSATAEAGEPAHSVETGSAIRSLWWKWTAPASGPVRIDTAGSSFDTVLAVYRGSSLATLSLVAANDDAGLASTSCVTFDAFAGESYSIAVDGFAGSSGQVALSVSQNSAGLVYQSSFEAVPLGVGTLTGVQGWQSLFADDVSGVMSSGGINRAYLTAALTSGNAAALWLPLNYQPAEGDTRVFSVITDLSIPATGSFAGSSYVVLLYSEAGYFLAGIEIDPQSGALYRLDGEQQYTLNASMARGQDYRLILRLDADGNTWSAWLGGTRLFDGVELSAVETPVASLGSLCVGVTSDNGPDVNAAPVLLSSVVVAAEAGSVNVPGSSAAGSPYQGLRQSIPGRLELEYFNEGGHGVATFDTSATNQGGGLRAGEVDILPLGQGGFSIGWLEATEWMNYAVTVAKSARYRFDVRVTSRGAGGTFRLELDGVDISGPMAVPDTGSWTVWTSVPVEAQVEAGDHTLTFVGLQNGSGNGGYVGDVDYIECVEVTSTPPVTEPPVIEPPVTEPPAGSPTPSPYQGVRQSIPGRLEVEFYDEGGPGVATFDLTPENLGGMLRAGEVDLVALAGGGFNVGWFRATEWMTYSVSVAEAGRYRADVRVASPGVGGTFRLELDGADLTGPLSVPATGSWTLWATVSCEVVLPAGDHLLKLVALAGAPDGGNVGDIDWIDFTAVTTPVVEPPVQSPLAPTNPIVPRQTDGRVAVQWETIPGATNYEIWRSSTGTFGDAELVGSCASASYEDCGGAEGKAYTYWVLGMDGDTVIGTGTVSAVVQSTPRLVNISTRGVLRPGAPLIAGLVINGSASRQVLLRAVGPGLEEMGVSGVAMAPSMTVVAAGSIDHVVAHVAPGWDAAGRGVEIAATAEANGAFALPPGSMDAATVLELAPGSYSVIVDDAAGLGGVCLVEAYVLDQAGDLPASTRVANLSTRGFAGSGHSTLIGGLVVEGELPRRFLIRAVGPTLADFGVGDALADPLLWVYRFGEDVPFTGNNDWSSDSAVRAAVNAAVAATGAFECAVGSRDAGMVVELPPGAYTVQLSGAGGGEGTALVEIYEVPMVVDTN